MLEIVVTSTPEIVEDTTPATVVETVVENVVVDSTSAGPDILAEQVVTSETVVEAVPELVIETTEQIILVEALAQGPIGPAGPQGAQGIQGVQGPPAAYYPGKQLEYLSGLLSEVRLYNDAACTSLAERRVLTRDLDGVTQTITFFDGVGSPTRLRSFTYTAGVLTGVVDT